LQEIKIIAESPESGDVREHSRQAMERSGRFSSTGQPQSFFTLVSADASDTITNPGDGIIS
jgi:hypothetical protein